MSDRIHGINPNGDHLTVCGKWHTGGGVMNRINQLERVLPIASFLGLLVYGQRHDMCPRCVNGVEFNIREWRRETGNEYDPEEM